MDKSNHKYYAHKRGHSIELNNNINVFYDTNNVLNKKHTNKLNMDDMININNTYILPSPLRNKMTRPPARNTRSSP